MADHNQKNNLAAPEVWPGLPLEEWKDTYATLHMWTQIVGKIRLAQSPLVNHWWNVPLYVTPAGRYVGDSLRHEDFRLAFDFIELDST